MKEVKKLKKNFLPLAILGALTISLAGCGGGSSSGTSGGGTIQPALSVADATRSVVIDPDQSALPDVTFDVKVTNPDASPLNLSDDNQVTPAKDVHLQFSSDSEAILFNQETSCAITNIEGSCKISLQPTSMTALQKLPDGVLNASILGDNAKPVPVKVYFLAASAKVSSKQPYLTYRLVTLSQQKLGQPVFTLTGLEDSSYQLEHDASALPSDLNLCHLSGLSTGPVNVTLPANTASCQLAFKVATNQPVGKLVPQQIDVAVSPSQVKAEDSANLVKKIAFTLDGGVDLYAAGENGDLASWNGSIWQLVNTGSTKNNTLSSIAALTLFQGNLYIGGGSGVAEWDGKKLTPTDSHGPGSITSLVAAKDSLYTLNKDTGKIFSLANGSWSQVQTSASDFKPFTMTAAPDGRLMVAGNDTKGAFIQQYSNKKWTAVKKYLTDTKGIVSLFYRRNLLYAEGNKKSGGYYLAKLNAAGNWSELGNKLLPRSFQAIVPGGDDIYGGVALSPDSSAPYVYRWDGTNWHSLTQNAAFSGPVASLLYYDGMLYAGAGPKGTTDNNNVQQWSGNSWSPLGKGLIQGEVTSLVVVPSISIQANTNN